MNTIVGQKAILSLFSKYTLASMPSTLLLLGEKGSGKTYIAQKLAKQLEIDFIELTGQTTAEELIDYSQSPITKLYHIDLSEITEKAQNKFLKFIEEPSTSVKVILEAESEVGVLPTILNRCYKVTLESYTVEELQSFPWAPKTQNDILYKFYNTPGKLNNLGNTNTFDVLQALCQTILNHFATSPLTEYANAMTLSNKFSHKKEDSAKPDFKIFLDVFAYTAFEHYKETKQTFSFQAYLLAVQQKQKILNKAVAKEAVTLNFLNQLWEAAHDTKGY